MNCGYKDGVRGNDCADYHGKQMTKPVSEKSVSQGLENGGNEKRCERCGKELKFIPAGFAMEFGTGFYERCTCPKQDAVSGGNGEIAKSIKKNFQGTRMDSYACAELETQVHKALDAKDHKAEWLVSALEKWVEKWNEHTGKADLSLEGKEVLKALELYRSGKP